jgi:serpin B
VLDADTRLVLVNAIYLKAPWFRRFEPSATATRPFTRADGRVLQVPTMSAPTMSGRYTRGPGWQAVDLPYAGQQLAMAVVLPDPGRLADVERAFDGAMLARVLSGFSPATVDLQLPRWTARTKVDLVGVLAEMGMPRAMSAVADFSGMTRAERLAIGAVPHETFVEVTEKGTEAAAATAVKVGWVSAGPPRLPVAVDRTFLYVIHDVATATPLFVGRVDDPTAG